MTLLEGFSVLLVVSAPLIWIWSVRRLLRAEARAARVEYERTRTIDIDHKKDERERAALSLINRRNALAQMGLLFGFVALALLLIALGIWK